MRRTGDDYDDGGDDDSVDSDDDADDNHDDESIDNDNDYHNVKSTVANLLPRNIKLKCLQNKSITDHYDHYDHHQACEPQRIHNTGQIQ